MKTVYVQKNVIYISCVIEVAIYFVDASGSNCVWGWLEPVIEDGEFHPWQARSAAWDSFLVSRGKIWKNNPEMALHSSTSLLHCLCNRDKCLFHFTVAGYEECSHSLITYERERILKIYMYYWVCPAMNCMHINTKNDPLWIFLTNIK